MEILDVFDIYQALGGYDVIFHQRQQVGAASEDFRFSP